VRLNLRQAYGSTSGDRDGEQVADLPACRRCLHRVANIACAAPSSGCSAPRQTCSSSVASGSSSAAVMLGPRTRPRRRPQTTVDSPGRAPQHAVSRARWVVGPRAAGDRSDTVYHEVDVPRATADALDADGFTLREVSARTQFLGHVNVISRDSDGIFTAGSDPRSDDSVAIVEVGDM
jgi:Gamma-glutamyltranspeptidase